MAWSYHQEKNITRPQMRKQVFFGGVYVAEKCDALAKKIANA